MKAPGFAAAMAAASAYEEVAVNCGPVHVQCSYTPAAAAAAVAAGATQQQQQEHEQAQQQQEQQHGGTAALAQVAAGSNSEVL